ncbi:MAG: permease [Luteolibacter sp.]
MKPSCCTPDPVPSCCGGKSKPAEAPASKASCCGGGEEAEGAAPSCCASSGKKHVDWLLWASIILVAVGMAGYLWFPAGPKWWHEFSHGTYEMMLKAWWGILAGIIAVGVIGRLPRELVLGLLGKGGSFSGILRATFAGTLLDLCNHGILLVAMQLYRKGASLGQTLAFLIASPWNSLSVTLLLGAMIGWKWTVAFLLLSMVIGIVTGWIVDRMVKAGRLPANPNAHELPEDFRFGPAFRTAMHDLKPTPSNLGHMLKDGLAESKMILRWILFGIALAALIQAFVPDDVFSRFFGPSLIGLFITLFAATVIEVCSEGSSPIAADLITRGAAPGNAFTFLMAGAATDYTEIVVLRQTTGSWKAALILPLLTTPQVLLIGWLLNQGW